MPIVSKFYGMIIRIYWDDHPPPHLHVRYGSYEAIFSIKTGKRTDGRLPKGAERIIEEWARQYRKELLEC